MTLPAPVLCVAATKKGGLKKMRTHPQALAPSLARHGCADAACPGQRRSSGLQGSGPEEKVLLSDKDSMTKKLCQALLCPSGKKPAWDQLVLEIAACSGFGFEPSCQSRLFRACLQSCMLLFWQLLDPCLGALAALLKYLSISCPLQHLDAEDPASLDMSCPCSCPGGYLFTSKEV